jgi:hypothetical protein
VQSRPCGPLIAGPGAHDIGARHASSFVLVQTYRFQG